MIGAPDSSSARFSPNGAWRRRAVLSMAFLAACSSGGDDAEAAEVERIILDEG
jgi:hypothetical protein